MQKIPQIPQQNLVQIQYRILLAQHIKFNGLQDARETFWKNLNAGGQFHEFGVFIAMSQVSCLDDY